jgi:dUTP pyrophosphatase
MKQHSSVNVPVLIEGSAELPNYASHGASGADVKAAISAKLVLKPGARALIPTGLRFEIPSGYEIQVRPRSGLAWNYGISVVNTPGTIDADYRGELKIILINHGDEEFVVEPGMRIAQIVLMPVVQGCFVPCQELSTTQRNEGGLGHTGTK